MKKIYTSLFILGLLLGSCSKGDPADLAADAPKLKFATQDWSTKVVYDAETGVWIEPGDEFMLIATGGGTTPFDTDGVKYTFAGEQRAKTGDLEQSATNHAFPTESRTWAMIYPFEAGGIVSEPTSKIKMTLPAQQTYLAAGFNKMPMAAVFEGVISQDSELRFKQYGVIFNVPIKIGAENTAPQITVKSIELTNNESAADAKFMAGGFNVSLQTPPLIGRESDASETVTLDCAAGVEINAVATTSFHIGAICGDLTEGINIKVSYTDGTADYAKTFKLAGPLSLASGKIYELPTLELSVAETVQTETILITYLEMTGIPSGSTRPGEGSFTYQGVDFIYNASYSSSSKDVYVNKYVKNTTPIPGKIVLVEALNKSKGAGFKQNTQVAYGETADNLSAPVKAVILPDQEDIYFVGQYPLPDENADYRFFEFSPNPIYAGFSQLRITYIPD